MNQNKFNGEGSNHANFAKKATLATITAMAALTLAACGNNDAGAKSAGSSEPKTEQSATNNNANNNSNNSSENKNSDETQTFQQFITYLKKAGFEVISSSNGDDGIFRANVKIDGYSGYISGSSIPNNYSLDFSESLGKSGTSHDLDQSAEAIKKMIANK